MVLATMADSSEREELEKLIEDWNASRLDMFTISKPDANLEFSGNMRFYFQESGSKDTKVSTKVLRVSSSDTTDEVMKVLVSKFHPDMKMLTMPNYSLYEVHETGAEAHKLELDQRPLYVQLYWQREDRDGRFLLKSEDDKMTQRLFEDEESARNPDKRNSKQRQSKRGAKNKKRSSHAEVNNKNLATALYEDKPASSFTRSKSNPEAVLKLQRKKKLEDRLKKLQEPETSGGGGGPLRIFAESLQPENPYKTILCASNDTTVTVLKEALEKYEVPFEEMDQYCLTMVTIAPGNHSDPESSSGIKERVVPDKDCPAGIAASWPENSGELRFYLKKKENMPRRKQKQQQRMRHGDPSNGSDRPGLLASEHRTPPTKETTFDVNDHSPTEKEPSSPAVHIVDAAHDLPATLEFRESGEDAFFAVVVSEVNGSAVNFKLAPTFTLYMCCRYRLSPKFRPDFSSNKRKEKVMMTANKVANMMWQTVKEHSGMAGHLAFWMANSSEFLHFLKQDMELSSMTEESQKILAHTTQQAFLSLVKCIKAELEICLPAVLDPSEENDLDDHGDNSIDDKFDQMDGYHSTQRSFNVRQYGSHGQPLGGDQWMGKRNKNSRPVVADVLYTLKAAMSLLRRCRVNPALTIQLFSQIFHFINMRLFNRIVFEPQLKLCSRSWGVRLLARLERLQVWAESQGLELAAECHLARISQAALLLRNPKQDSTMISSQCYKLNSLQLRQLLEHYQPERDEQAISPELIEKAVNVAKSTADEMARSEGQQVLLEEEPELYLPFLLPDDGYSSEKIRGVPPGLKEFLDPLITPGLCRLTIQPKASGLWTVHFKIPADPDSPPLEVINISINKGNKGMGVSIVAAKGPGQEFHGIYVSAVTENGPAALDGRLHPGDQILDVNGESLVNVLQEDAVKILTKAGTVVHMKVAKRAVYKHGLVESLNKVIPVQKPVPAPKRTPDNKNISPPVQKKETPRPPPRYPVAPQDSPQRLPPLKTSLEPEVNQKAKPEPANRRNPHERNSHGPPEQPPLQAKTVVEYKSDEAPPSRKPPVVKVGVALPYGNPQEIQKRQREMQQRKGEDRVKEDLERERVVKEEERMKKIQEEREEAERLERLKREELQERQRIERERQERERIERERQERERIEKEQQERQRRKMEEQERQRREKEEAERKRREEWEKMERERKEREEAERRRQEEERKKQEQERLLREKENDKRLQQENLELDEMSRRERELQMMLDQKRREKEKRLRELELQIQKEREESERMEQELMDRLKREREERKETHRINRPSEEQQQRMGRPPGGGTQVHYVNNQGYENENNEVNRNEASRNRPVRAPTPANDNRGYPSMDNSRRPPDANRNEEMGLKRPMDYNKRGPAATDENKGTPPLGRRHLASNGDNRGNYSPGKRQNSKDDSFDMDPAEVERQFQMRLAQETAGQSEVDGNMVKVIRVPVQQDNLESRGRDMDDRPRARVDWQREEEERNRKEQKLRREQDEQLVRDIQLSESFRQQPSGTIAEPVHPQQQADWGKEEELRRQREEDDRLREARANQLRNRNIERCDDDDEDVRDTSYNGRTRRVKFATVRTEIIQPSPDAEKATPGVKFVHDGKVVDSDDEEFPHAPPPIDEEDPPQYPPPPQDPLHPPPPYYRDNENIVRVRPRVSDEGYATYPGRQQHNNNFPVAQPRVGAAAEFSKSPSPDNSRLPFNDKMKVFNENTPPKRQIASKWEQRLINGDSLRHFTE